MFFRIIRYILIGVSCFFVALGIAFALSTRSFIFSAFHALWSRFRRERHHKSKIAIFNYEFGGTVPENIEIIKFDCSGFQDFELKAEFLIDNKNAEPLFRALDGVKKHSSIESNSEKTEYSIDYLLNNQVAKSNKSIFHAVDITITRPLDGSSKTHVYFNGYQY
jgi:hypothetical protein